jgi:hypothetical protein
MAEIEPSILTWQGLNRRISDTTALKREVKVWKDERNAKNVEVDWRFTTSDARIKLRHLYAVIHEGLSGGRISCLKL